MRKIIFKQLDNVTMLCYINIRWFYGTGFNIQKGIAVADRHIIRPVIQMEEEEPDPGGLVHQEIQFYRPGNIFPKADIMARIEKIKNMKDELLLDDLATMFTPDLIELTLTREELIERNIVTINTLDYYSKTEGNQEFFSFEKALILYILDQAFHSGEISLEEGKALIDILTEGYPRFKGKNCELYFIRKLGVSLCFLASSPAEIQTEKNTRILLHINIGSSIEELKTKVA
jgi:hypothetical protein